MINAEYFKLAHRFTRPDHPERPELGGVLIEPCLGGGVVMFATNGMAGCAVYDPQGSLPVSMCIRLDTGDDEWERFLPSAQLAFEGPQASLRVPEEGGTPHSYPYSTFDPFKYPAWRRLFPDGNRIIKSTGVAFDLQLLNLFAFDGDQDPIGLWVYEKEAEAPRLVTHSGYPTFIGIIMPIKVDEEHMFQRPTWLNGKEPRSDG